MVRNITSMALSSSGSIASSLSSPCNSCGENDPASSSSSCSSLIGSGENDSSRDRTRKKKEQ